MESSSRAPYQKHESSTRTPPRPAPLAQSRGAGLADAQAARVGREPTSTGEILALQRVVGNQAVSRLLAEQSTQPAAARQPGPGVCLQRILGPYHLGIQAKLTVGAAGDAYEQEADRVADRVLAMAPGGDAGQGTLASRDGVQREGPDGKIQAGSLAASISRVPDARPAAPEREAPVLRSEEGDASVPSGVARRPVGPEGGDAGPGMEAALAASSGRPLPDGVRADLEPRFGADFSAVRIHSGPEVARLSQDLGAQAFTRGQDVFIPADRYDPGTSTGVRLLAHELTHTIQQREPGAVRRWMPTGHSSITQKVFADEQLLATSYDRDAQKYLADRSPDMDYIQDEQNAMATGMAKSDPIIKQFKKLLKKGHAGGLISMGQAMLMWNKNDLHQRPDWYMLHHGEGGMYKMKMHAAAPKNRAITEALLQKAAALYLAGAHAAGLSILSDALHQAEDRGAHEEGAEFHGHDIRQTIDPRLIKGSKKGAAWPEMFRLPAEGEAYYKGKPEPDNISVNPSGAMYGLKYAGQALELFLQKVNFKLEIDGPISLKKPEEQGGEGPRQRRAKIRGIYQSSSGKLGQAYSKKVTHVEALGNIKPENWADVIKTGPRRAEKQEVSEEGQKEINVSLERYLDGWVASEIERRLRDDIKKGKYRSRAHQESREGQADGHRDGVSRPVRGPGERQARR